MSTAADLCPRRTVWMGPGQKPVLAEHLYYGGSVCALCGQQKSQDEPALVIDPQAFREGERMAYDRVLAYLATLPQEAATKGRDNGRGMAHAVRDLVVYVTTLRDDLGDE